jgi:hypothetical protein
MPTMNCEKARNRILAVADPSELPPRLGLHLRECPSCRAWRTRLLAMERALTRLPVPDGGDLARVALLEKLLEPAEVEPKPEVIAPPMPKRPAAVVPAAAPIAVVESVEPVRKEPSRWASRLWPAGLVAATLLIATIAWLSLRGGKPPVKPTLPADPMLDNMVRLNVELARAQTAADSVRVLAKIADELNGEMREIARADATGENMRALEEMYRKIVLRAIVEQAARVERSQREEVLTAVVKGLTISQERTRQMAQESPEHSAEALNRAAETAEEGKTRLRRLIREALA